MGPLARYSWAPASRSARPTGSSRLARQVEVRENDVHVAAGEALAPAREVGDGIDLPGGAVLGAEARFDRASVRRVSYEEEDTQAGAVGGDSAHITILPSAYTASLGVAV